MPQELAMSLRRGRDLGRDVATWMSTLHCRRACIYRLCAFLVGWVCNAPHVLHSGHPLRPFFRQRETESASKWLLPPFVPQSLPPQVYVSPSAGVYPFFTHREHTTFLIFC